MRMCERRRIDNNAKNESGENNESRRVRIEKVSETGEREREGTLGPRTRKVYKKLKGHKGHKLHKEAQCQAPGETGGRTKDIQLCDLGETGRENKELGRRER